MPRLNATLCVGAVLASTVFAASRAAAATSGTLALTSDYLFRGISQTNQKPALQGGIEYAHDSGFYLGAWGSNISWLSDYSSAAAPISSSLELDVYAGWRGNLGESLKLDAGIYSYYYPGDYPHGFVRPYTTEVYVGLALGPAALKYYHSAGNLFGFADSDGSGYLDASVNYEFSPGWLLNAHAGRQRVKGNSAASYTDWKLGLTRNFDRGWSLALAYADTDAERAVYTNAYGNFLGRSTGTLTLTKAF
ncbi:TorF family putative porin [Tahibacter harae]|uniref:TorF family putative porin n=1 Tax=Tahibacter harae TaxID=2963937 RepID=A0ABT1QXR2_9GAMM|nr:TorF family putative porin [Tahibacter harae]MCQ4167076.1 TorF family putative porin [Tahibacter harae]